MCIVQSSCINVHTVTGKDFISPLPFQVRGEVYSMWFLVGSFRNIHLWLKCSVCSYQYAFFTLSVLFVYTTSRFQMFGWPSMDLCWKEKTLHLTHNSAPLGMHLYWHTCTHTVMHIADIGDSNIHKSHLLFWIYHKESHHCYTYSILTFLLFYREPLPTVFSMVHPVDEIAPVVCKPTGKTQTL